MTSVNPKTQQRVWLECTCTHPAHSVRVVVDRGDEFTEPFLIIEPVVPTSPGFWIRLKRAFRYLFFFEPIHVMESILDDESIDKLVRAITNYKLYKKLHNSRNQKRT